MIPYGRQDIRAEDIAAVTEVLASDFLTQGPVVPKFEQALAQYTGAKHALAMNSATSALHTACLALGLGAGDWLWTTPITFVASANCGLYCGAKVDFVDIAPHTYLMDPDALEAKLLLAQSQGCLPKVVVPVHLCGQSCDMPRIWELSQRFGFKIIEDASHAVGGRDQQGNPIGRGLYSHVTIFSFHPVKIITTAEGGVALTNDDNLAQRMDLLRSHGITRNPDLMTHQPDGPWYYQQIDLGFNYRMTEMQAALGLSQMTRLDEYVAERNRLAGLYDQKLEQLPIDGPMVVKPGLSAYHLYVIKLRDPSIHGAVFTGLRARGIGVNLHYIPVHTQPFYQDLGFKVGQFPKAEDYYSRAISLPLYPQLGESGVDQVMAALADALREAGGV